MDKLETRYLPSIKFTEEGYVYAETATFKFTPPPVVNDATGVGDVVYRLNELLIRLRELGIIAK